MGRVERAIEFDPHRYDVPLDMALVRSSTFGIGSDRRCHYVQHTDARCESAYDCSFNIERLGQGPRRGNCRRLDGRRQEGGLEDDRHVPTLRSNPDAYSRPSHLGIVRGEKQRKGEFP